MTMTTDAYNQVFVCPVYIYVYKHPRNQTHRNHNIPHKKLHAQAWFRLTKVFECFTLDHQSLTTCKAESGTQVK